MLLATLQNSGSGRPRLEREHISVFVPLFQTRPLLPARTPGPARKVPSSFSRTALLAVIYYVFTIHPHYHSLDVHA